MENVLSMVNLVIQANPIKCPTNFELQQLVIAPLKPMTIGTHSK